jgi:hypothetical protein
MDNRNPLLEYDETMRPMRMIQETSGRIGFDVIALPVDEMLAVPVYLGTGDGPANAKVESNTRRWWHCVVS